MAPNTGGATEGWWTGCRSDGVLVEEVMAPNTGGATEGW